MKHSYLQLNYKTKNRRRPTKLAPYFSWLISKHNSSKFVQEHELELAGVPLMIEGLNYHFANFKKIEKKVLQKYNVFSPDQIPFYDPARILPKHYMKAFYEIGAYMCVLGRLETLITSWWIEQFIPESTIASLIPSILALVPLRHKYFAHRSFDDPRKKHEKKIQNAQISGISEKKEAEDLFETHLALGLCQKLRGNIGEKPNLSYEIKIHPDDRHWLLKDHHPKPVHDIEWLLKAIFINFIPSKHHPLIIVELRAFATQLFSDAIKKA